VFTRNAFDAENLEVAKILNDGGGRRVLALVEESVAAAWPNLAVEIERYFKKTDLNFRGLYVMPGGESIKADDRYVREAWERIDTAHLDRHSYLLVIGGGAFLDAIGFAAATAHRGVRLVRFPTTTLSQDDSGVGVKCAINAFGKKNWVGAFSVPFAVINDFCFLHSQPEDTRRSGLIEAVKVALVKDAQFFEWIEQNIDALSKLEPAALESCVEKSGILHAEHIATGGDPFETGSSRPLDFGHWAAHKLEALSSYRLSHGHAVAVGLALDTLYSSKAGIADASLAERVLKVLTRLGLDTYHAGLDWLDDSGNRRVFEGLDEFREHLGGELTVLMLNGVGQSKDVHEIDTDLMGACIDELREASVTIR